MPLRKIGKLREMTTEELKKEEKELAGQLFKLKFQLASGQIEKPQKIRVIRKDIARVKTLLRERELSIEKK